MSPLTTLEIAARGALLWLVGILAITAISAYTARPSRSGPVSTWMVIPILMAKGGMLLGCVAVGLLIGRATVNLGSNVAMLIGGVGLFSFLWASLIVIQFAQNIGYDFVGAKRKPIRWFNDGKKPARRKPAHKAP